MKYIMFVMIIFNNECNITSLLILLNDIEELYNVNKISFCLADIIYRFHNLKVLTPKRGCSKISIYIGFIT